MAEPWCPPHSGRVPDVQAKRELQHLRKDLGWGSCWVGAKMSPGLFWRKGFWGFRHKYAARGAVPTP